MNLIYDFILFSLIGYITELFHCSLYKRKSGKALKGPWCPLYGLGGLIILNITKLFPKNIFYIYILGVIISSLLEYIISLILETIFKKRWWNYKNKKYNLNGRICLQNSLLFGLLSLVLNYIYIPIKECILVSINLLYIRIILLLVGLIMIIDFIVTLTKELKKITK